MNFKVASFLSIIQMLITVCSSTKNERNLGLSSLAGSVSNAVNLLGAAKLVNDMTKVADPGAIVGTAIKTMNQYSPVVIPQAGDNKNNAESIKLDDRDLRLHLPQEMVNQLINMTGLQSSSIDWSLYRLPLTVQQFRSILVSQKSSPSQMSFMSMDAYLPKLLANFDKYYGFFREHIESEMLMDEFMEAVERVDKTEIGLTILPVNMKSGAVQNRPGSFVLLGLGKFPLDRKLAETSTIVPTIVMGTIKQPSPIQYKSESATESSPAPDNGALESPSEPESASTDIIEVNESPIADDEVLISSPLESEPSQSFSSNQPQVQPQPQPQVQPQPQPQSQLQPPPQVQPQPQPKSQPQQFYVPQPISPPSQPRPVRPQRPPQNFQMRPPAPSFDGRPPIPHQSMRPTSRPRPDMQG